MDVDFMLSDSLEVCSLSIYAHLFSNVLQAVRPKLEIAKTIEQAAIAVDEMFNSAYQSTGNLSIYFFPCRITSYSSLVADDSGDDSDEEGERRDDKGLDDEEQEDFGEPDSPVCH